MANFDRREILSRVAAGQITPEEAASQLDAITRDEPDESAIRKVRVVKQFGTLEIVADPTVREAVAEGPHRVRIDADVMVLEGETASDWGGFFFGGGRDWAHQTLRIRMNPALPLDLQVQAGTCRVRGVEAPIRADIQAGSATIDGFRNELDVSVQAGSLKASGRLDEGDSRINCNAGSVSLHLQRGSSVRIKARTNLGKVELPGEASLRQNRSAQEAIIGDGGGSLLIEGNMGSVRVTADG